MTLHDCRRVMQQHRVVECVPNGVDVACTITKEQHLKKCVQCNKGEQGKHMLRQNSRTSLTIAIARLDQGTECLGLYSEKWARLLTSSNPVIQEGIHLANCPELFKTFLHPKNNKINYRSRILMLSLI